MWYISSSQNFPVLFCTKRIIWETVTTSGVPLVLSDTHSSIYRWMLKMIVNGSLPNVSGGLFRDLQLLTHDKRSKKEGVTGVGHPETQPTFWARLT